MEALIFDSKVVQIEAVQFPVAPALTWVDITGIVPSPEIGWSFDGRDFTAPSPLPPPPPKSAENLSAEEVATELVRKGLITRAEFNDIKSTR